MATKTPRIAVTLSEESYEIVSRLAAAQQSSRSRIIAEVINDLAPIMGQLVDTMEAAARMRAENVQGVRDASMDALGKLEPMLAEAQESMELLDLMMRRAGEDPQPPASNTGVASSVSHSNHSNRGSAKRGAK